MNFYDRTQLLLGQSAVNKLAISKVAIFGIGGVGSYVAEGLARAGVGNLVLIDADKVEITNINRQIVALHSTIGSFKAQVMQERIKDINPACNITIFNKFYLDGDDYIIGCDYVVDAIDTITAKINLAVICGLKNIPLISAMGAGNKMHPELFEISDIFDTSVCPLCRVMRRELKKREVKSLKVVYSKEEPINVIKIDDPTLKKIPPGSISFTPSVMGLIIASEVVRNLVGYR